MNSRMATAACLSVFAATSLSLPSFALKTATAVGKPSIKKMVGTKLTKKVKKVSMYSKAAPVIACGKK